MNNDKERYTEAWHKGQRNRRLQDEILAMFVEHIQRINDIDTLEAIKGD
ncbi:hypothetical protein GLV94_01940 [Virgibacillus halodenitrificans]|nr:hypothetical protein [Virgibacillus halodenitrificans]MYL44395.1 hypothetical protein [Virgibacillus halodenitrificans]